MNALTGSLPFPMDNFNDNRQQNSRSTTPARDEVDDVVNNAIERMKSGAVVKEDRKLRLKGAIVVALVIAALAAFSTLDFVFQTPDSETAANGEITITLKADHDGHYMAKGSINGQSVNFLVDTGASAVSIPMDTAKKLGLPLGRKFSTITANGYGTSYETGIKTISLGDITLKGVDASVSEGLVGGQILLGMSFLKRTRIEQDKGVMKIIY